MSSSSSPYAPAARLLTQIWTSHKSIKTLAYDKRGELRCSKATYAQVCHVLEHKHLLDGILNRVGGFDHVRNEGLLYVLLYELLLGPNKCIRGGGALKRQLMERNEELQRALTAEMQAAMTTSTETVSFPRYVRINTLQSDSDEVVSTLQSQHEQIYQDTHVPNLLVLPPATALHNDTLVKSGKVILQDKSSCFSALCLVHGSKVLLNGDYMDACAAPGNKTSHLAALLGEQQSKSKCRLYALDRSSQRLASLQRRMKHLVPSSNIQVVSQHLDFLKTRPSDYPKLRTILLDPSCSGSGIFTSLERQQQQVVDQSRIQSLSNFQLTMLRHAMSFDQVERIVYSTCSVHKKENEVVVAQALQTNHDWQLVAPICLKEWKRRGRVVDGLSKKQASCLVRADREDETNGFFVAYFERRNISSQQEATRHLKLKISPIEGVPVYNGEFASTKTKSDSRETTAAASTAAPREPVPKTVAATSSSTKPAAMNKKRAKKLAWKRKQREEKLKRIQAKKAKL